MIIFYELLINFYLLNKEQLQGVASLEDSANNFTSLILSNFCSERQRNKDFLNFDDLTRIFVPSEIVEVLNDFDNVKKKKKSKKKKKIKKKKKNLKKKKI